MIDKNNIVLVTSSDINGMLVFEIFSHQHFVFVINWFHFIYKHSFFDNSIVIYVAVHRMHLLFLVVCQQIDNSKKSMVQIVTNIFVSVSMIVLYELKKTHFFQTYTNFYSTLTIGNKNL